MTKGASELARLYNRIARHKDKMLVKTRDKDWLDDAPAPRHKHEAQWDWW